MFIKPIITSIILFITFTTNTTLSQKCYETLTKDNLGKVSQNKTWTKFNINRISTYIYANGNTDIKPDGNSGFEYPNGEDKYAVFESGIVWGGKVNGEIRVGGSTYAQGLLPGRILEDGIRANDNDPTARIYKVRPDFASADLSSEMADEQLTEDEIRTQYQKDWEDWPGQFGAPFEDVDKDGVYNPTVDIPGVSGSHQTIWYVANDLDVEACKSLYDSEPMNVEFQVTIWGYNIPGHLENVMFKKYKLINKSENDFTDMYLSQWSDVDLGDAADDYQGIDTLLNLQYVYNGDDYDSEYGLVSPAIGFQLLQGPVVQSPNGTAYINGKDREGFKNLDMTSFIFYLCGSSIHNSPDLGEYKTGTIQTYFNMCGLLYNGVPNEIPKVLGGGITKFPLSGNPITGEGWIQGIEYRPCEAWGMFSSGPFNIAPGEAQEIIIAQFGAQGKDRFNSIAILKFYADMVKRNYPNITPAAKTPDITNLIPTIKKNKYGAFDIIKLNIERSDSIENFSESGYKFQGYNIYQLNDNNDNYLIGHKIFTYDLIDNVSGIYGETYDPSTGYIINDLVQFGSNTGIPNEIIIDEDYNTEPALLKGKTYYYGISAYFLNEEISKVIETKLNTIDITFQEDLAGAKYLDIIESQSIVGNSDVDIITEIVDPYKLTGDTYEVTFGQQHYYLDGNWNWVKTNYPDSVGRTLNKPNDVSGSRLIALPSIYAENQTLDLYFLLERQSPDFNNIDGVKITFPGEIKINKTTYLITNTGTYKNGVISGQSIICGNNDTSANGDFTGGEIFYVNIDYTDPTFKVNYDIYDDGSSKYYLDEYGDSTYFNLGKGTINASGDLELTGEIGLNFKTELYWDLFDKTKNEYALEYQTIFSGSDINNGEKFEYGYESIIDGFMIKINGTFQKPINYSEIKLESPSGLTSFTTSSAANSTQIAISNYTVFAGTITSWAIDNFGVGTSNIVVLQQDYELRFTGVFDNGTTINGQKIYRVIEGGQMATVFRMRDEGSLGSHPLNPQPGIDKPFLIRIPFEVWNIEDPNNPYQVNFTFRDRVRDGTENPFYSWNLSNRMYGIIVNSQYNPNQVIQVDNGHDEYNKDATWALVFYRTNYHEGDVVKIIYNNPIQLTDVYSFTAPESPTEKISPNNYTLFQNYPNPFNPNTKIRYSIPEDGNVKITIYNILGQMVTEVLNGNQKAGKYETEFNGSNFASGVYIYRVEANNFVQSKKMLLSK